MAFGEHRPLMLAPSYFWTPITRQFACFVKTRPELRNRFVSHNWQMSINVTDGPWHKGSAVRDRMDDLCEEFAGEVGKHVVSDQIAREFHIGFGNSSQTDEGCGPIALMNGLKGFFSAS
jgi:hypothetical protein